MAVACSVASPPCHQYSSSPVRYVFRDAAAVRRDDRCSTRLRFERWQPRWFIPDRRKHQNRRTAIEIDCVGLQNSAVQNDPIVASRLGGEVVQIASVP
jgi:hypothetical protein